MTHENPYLTQSTVHVSTLPSVSKSGRELGLLDRLFLEYAWAMDTYIAAQAIDSTYNEQHTITVMSKLTKQKPRQVIVRGEELLKYGFRGAIVSRGIILWYC